MTASLPGYAEAAAFIAGYAVRLVRCKFGDERVALGSATGRVLAQPIFADREMPSFPRSTRDGFACRAVEASSHALLAITGSIRAGDPPAPKLPPGAAWEIMTGAAVPEGADAVMMLEHTQQDQGAVRLAAPRMLNSGENVIAAGAEAHAGHELVLKGKRLGPAHVAVAAACGFADLQVFTRPRVAILTTGDELVRVEAEPAPGQIRNSNAAMLAALTEQAGGEPWILPTVEDEIEQIYPAIRSALEADLILISGGVSAGKFDLVEPALARLGALIHFTGVRIQPGKPLVFGELPTDRGAALPVFGLPGNPISSAATFLLFAAPVLGALAGSSETLPRFDTATVSHEVKGKPDLTRFVPAFTCGIDEDSTVAPVGSQGSSDLAAFARADCFLVVPEGVDHLPAGSPARILRF